MYYVVQFCMLQADFDYLLSAINYVVIWLHWFKGILGGRLFRGYKYYSREYDIGIHIFPCLFQVLIVYAWVLFIPRNMFCS